MPKKLNPLLNIDLGLGPWMPTEVHGLFIADNKRRSVSFSQVSNPHSFDPSPMVFFGPFATVEERDAAERLLNWEGPGNA